MAGAADRLRRVRDAVDRAATAAGRETSAVRLVAVGKTFPADALEAVYRAGARDFGENRVQEADNKAPHLPEDVRWHLVGHLQANKAARAVELFSTIHSVDSLKIAQRLERLASDAGRTIEALVQVDLAGEETKFGVAEAELPALLAGAADFRHVTITGLMLLPPYDPDPEGSRPYFRRLSEISAHMRREGLLGSRSEVELSMGMSHDFPVAIEEGATLVRVGTAIFGPREATPRKKALSATGGGSEDSGETA